MYRELRKRLFGRSRKVPGCFGSSIGRAPVSKTGGCGFESRPEWYETRTIVSEV